MFFSADHVMMILTSPTVFFEFFLLSRLSVVMIGIDVGLLFGEAVSLERFDGRSGCILICLWMRNRSTEGMAMFFSFGKFFVHILTI